MEGESRHITPVDSGKGLLAGCLLVGALLLIHLHSLSSTLPPGESGTFITAACCLGVAPPPGYPLYVLIGKLFSLIPFGSPAWRLAFMDSLLNGLTLLTVYLFIMKSTGRTLAAIASTAFLGLSFIFIHSSSTGSVMPLVTFLTALTFTLLLTDESDDDREKGRRQYITAFLAGLTCSAHPVGFLLLPLVITIGAIRRSQYRTGAGKPGTSAGFFLLGLLPYLLIPLFALRDPYINWGASGSLSSFLHLLSGRDLFIPVLSASYGHLPLTIFTVETEFLLFFSLIKESMTVIVPALALTAIMVLYEKRRIIAFTLFWGIVITGPLLFLIMSLPDTPVNRGMMMPLLSISSFFLALASGFGLHALFSALEEREILLKLTERGRLAAESALLLLLLSPFLIFQVPRSLSMGDQVAEEYGRNILASLPEKAIILVSDPSLSVLSYLQGAVGLRKDIVIIGLPMYPWRARQIVERFPQLIDAAAPSHGKRKWADAELRRYKDAEAFVNAVVDKNAGRYPVYFDGTTVKDMKGMEAHLIPQGLVFRYMEDQSLIKDLISRESPGGVREKYSLRGLVMARRDRNPESRAFVELYVKAYFTAGIIYAMNELYDNAEEEFLTALALKPDFTPAQTALEQLRKKRVKKTPGEMTQ